MLYKNAKNIYSSCFNTMKKLSGNTRKEQQELPEKQIVELPEVLIFTSQLSEKFLSNKLIDIGQKKIWRKKRTFNSIFPTSTNEAEISSDLLMTYQVNRGSVRRGLHSNANLLENNLLLEYKSDQFGDPSPQL